MTSIENNPQEPDDLSRPHSTYTNVEFPKTQMDLIQYLQLPREARIIDIGAAGGYFIEAMFTLGFTDLSVLDRSGENIDRARARLGNRAWMVRWTVCDVESFTPETPHDLWHDSTQFHLLKTADEKIAYLNAARNGVIRHGYLVIRFDPGQTAFTDRMDGNEAPADSFSRLLDQDFEKIKTITEGSSAFSVLKRK